MTEEQLQFKYQVQSKSLKIISNQTLFAKIAALDQHPSIPPDALQHFSYESYQNIMIFKKKKQGYQIQILQKTIKQLLSSLTMTTKSLDKEPTWKFETLHKIYTKCKPKYFFRYALLNNTINIFYKKIQISKNLFKFAKTFMRQKLLYPMDEFLKKIKNTEEVLEKIFSSHRSIIENDALNFELYIKKMQTKISHHKKEPHASLYMEIEGNFLNINEFFIHINRIIKSIFIKVVSIDKIYSTDPEKQLPESVYLLKSNSLLIMNPQVNQQELITALRSNEWQLPQKFSKQQLKILKKEYQSKNLRRYMQERFIYWQQFRIQNQKIFIKCEQETLNYTKQILPKFIEQFKKVQEQSLQFTNPLLVKLFIKYYKQEVLQMYQSDFHQDDGKLIISGFEKDIEKIKQLLSSLKEKIYDELLVFPSGKSLSPYKELILEEKKMKNRRQYGKLYEININELKIPLIGYPIQKITEKKKSIIMLITGERMGQVCQQILSSNGTDIDKFINQDVKRKAKPQKVKAFHPPDSRSFYSIVLLYVQNRYNRYFQNQVTKAVNNEKDEKQLNIVFPYEISLMNEFMEIIVKMVINREINARAITFYYQNNETLSQIQKKLKCLSSNSIKIKRPMKKFLNQIDILKIKNLSEHVLKYEQYMLSPVGSFIFNYERNEKKKGKQRCVIFLPFNNYKNQFFINLVTNKVYKIVNNFEVEQCQPNSKMKKIITLIKKYFIIQYLMVYEEDGDYCQNLYEVKKENQLMLELKMKVNDDKIIKGERQINFQLINKNAQEWYFVQSHKKEVENLMKYI